MKGDFTRLTHRPRDHYSRVLQQQGRVQLDADWNEQVAIGLHLQRATTADLMGGCGAPCDAGAFGLTADGADIPTGGCASESLRLEAGHYYVDGVLVEVEDPVQLAAQPDLPEVGLPTDDGRYVAYLDVWEEHLTALERPHLREVALGGPDTTTRTRTVWQVKLEAAAAAPGGPACSEFGTDWTPQGAESTGRLAAQAAASGPMTDPCIIPPGAGYRRLENQLYRVEIHDGSQDAAGNDQTPTYVWSRDNGSVVLEVSSIVDRMIGVTQPARDAVLGFAPGDWVEISDEGRTLRGEPGIIVQLGDAQGTELTVTAWNGGPPALSPDYPTTVRRWESAGALPVVRGAWLDLEDGVQVQFEGVAGQAYRTGDHWFIPARSADIEGVATNVGGDVEWPEDPATSAPAFVPRHGVDHHYCPIATLERTTTGGTALWSVLADCRRIFPSLTDLTHLVYVGGDGQEAMPGFQLPQPIEVAVWNGGCTIQGSVVRFSTADGGELLAGGVTGTTVDVQTSGPDAVAACWWTLKKDGAASQRASATLLDDQGDPVGIPIDFSANLSVASEIAYEAKCEPLAGADTVQEALDLLCGNVGLFYVSGDGQEAPPNTKLPHTLQARVSNGQWPSQAKVLFSVVQGGGSVVGDAVLNATTAISLTDADGIAQVEWTLGPKGPQRVEARLGDEATPYSVAYNAQFSDTGGGGEPKPERGLHVTAVRFVTGDDLRNDDTYPVEILTGGIDVAFDGLIHPASVREKPVLIVTVELAYPERGDFVAAFLPVVLRARIDQVASDMIEWVPDDSVIQLLQQQVELAQRRGVERLLARLLLKGSFIWSEEDPTIFVDGNAFGEESPDGRTEILRRPDGTMSGDDHRGGDYEMWFWLIR